MQVHQDGVRVALRADRHKPLHDKQRALPFQGCVAIPEDDEGVLVIPVMEDALQNMDVSAFGYAVKEASCDNLAACGDSRRPQV
jgi:hypothetical protein